MNTPVQELARLGVATVYEAAGRAGLVEGPWIQVVPGSRAAGPARTVRCGQDDNLMVHAVMERVRPGDVLVVTMPRPAPVALVGEILALQAKVRGAAAVLVDAAVRDLEDLRALGLPIWARWVSVRGADKAEVGSVDVPVRVGGAVVHPEDLMVLDADGVVVVPSGRAEAVLEAARARAARESALRAQLEGGALTYDLHGLRGRVEGRTPG